LLTGKIFIYDQSLQNLEKNKKDKARNAMMDKKYQSVVDTKSGLVKKKIEEPGEGSYFN
jgi:hypothetical protein